MAIIDDFKARFPNFDSAVVDVILPIIEPIYPCYYGGSYSSPCGKEIILNLLAHLFVSETNPSNAPSKTALSLSADGVSTSFEQFASQESMQEKFFATTKYGKTYLMLINSSVGGFFV